MMAELVIEKEQLDRGDHVSWSAYHAKRQAADIRPVSNMLMPFFTKETHNAAMMAHAMKLSDKAI